jgi:hypothetical protein
MKKLIKSTALTMMIMSAAGVLNMGDACGMMNLSVLDVKDADAHTKLEQVTQELMEKVKEGSITTRDFVDQFLKEAEGLGLSTVAKSSGEKEETASSSSSSVLDPLSEEDKMLMGTLMSNTSNDEMESKRKFDILKSLPPDQRRCIAATAQSCSLEVSGNDIKILPELLEKVDWIDSLSIRNVSSGQSLELLLGGCKNLDRVKSFYMGDCSIACDIKELGKFPNLKVISLVNCPGVGGDIGALAPLKSLEYLNLEGVPVLGELNLLAALPSLKSVILKNCPQVGGSISSLASLGQLFYLTLDGMSCGGDVGKLSGYHALQILKLHDCKEITGDIGTLTACQKLESVDLKGCPNIVSDPSKLQELRAKRISVFIDGHEFK